MGFRVVPHRTGRKGWTDIRYAFRLECSVTWILHLHRICRGTHSRRYCGKPGVCSLTLLNSYISHMGSHAATLRTTVAETTPSFSMTPLQSTHRTWAMKPDILTIEAKPRGWLMPKLLVWFFIAMFLFSFILFLVLSEIGKWWSPHWNICEFVFCGRHSQCFKLIGLFAAKRIKPGDEVLLDYGPAFFNDTKQVWRDSYVRG